MSLHDKLKRVAMRSSLYYYYLAYIERFRDDKTHRRREVSQAEALYKGIVRPGDLVFDIGSNLGRRSEAFLALGARVIGIEADKDITKVSRLILGRRPNARFVNLAISDVADRIETLRCSPLSALSTMSSELVERSTNSGRWNSDTWYRTKQVKTTTIDRLIAEFGVPRFCKIDVEGFEVPALKGLTKPIEILSFEANLPELRDKAEICLERMLSLGDYRFNVTWSDKFQWDYPAPVDAATIRKAFDNPKDSYCDVLCILSQ